MQGMLPGTLEVPGVPRQAKSADFNNYLFILKILVQKGQKYLLFRLKKIHIATFYFLVQKGHNITF